MQLTFLGAAGGVTGSRFLVRTDDARVLVDCGLFQGQQAERERNWEPFRVDPSSIDAVLLTHAHLDHSGWLPRLVREGFSGPVWCTHGTRALCGLLLPDAAHLQEEEASYRNRTGTTRHQPALPLYTALDARRALERLQVVPVHRPFEAATGVTATLTPVGHLPGAVCVRLDDGRRSLQVSGDVGRPDDRLTRPPHRPLGADEVLIESTYGDRVHAAADPAAQLAELVSRTAARGGVLLVPAFAVGRVQLLLHLLAELTDAGRVPRVPLIVDSPLATNATELWSGLSEEHRLTPEQCRRMTRGVRFVNSVEESKALNAQSGPMIIVSSSGMATGGRVVHHLKARLGDARNTVLMTGFQAPGTRGEALRSGVEALRIHGASWPVRAEVATLRGVSGHADREQLLDWLSGLPRAPRRVWVVHGEPAAQDALRQAIVDRFGWEVAVARYRDTVDLG